MKKIIKVDEDLKELMPGYLLSRRGDVVRIAELLEAGDFDSLWTIGHKLHGSGGGFGLDFITETGARLEKAAKARDKSALKAEAAGLKDFLDSVEIEFVPLD